MGSAEPPDASSGRQGYEIDYVQLDTSNFGRMVEFYREILGLRAGYVETEHGYAQLRAGKVRLALRPGTSGLRWAPPGATIVFKVEDIRREIRTLEERGCAFHNVQLDDPEGYSIAYFKDPEGKSVGHLGAGLAPPLIRRCVP